jgi:YegS/Rv2252/BmrU family lipid kinase
VSIAVIINPISGTGGRLDAARRRAEMAADLAAARGQRAEVFLTERHGHGRELAAAALERGASLVIAWGGDGTVNEIASVLAFRDAALGVIPSGSGNGLARELGIPFDPAAAFAAALGGRARTIDCGELDGRLFFNVAGCGLDAVVAYRFASDSRRGFLRYLDITARELRRYQPAEHTIVANGREMRGRALIVAIANARQYGNGAIIAPAAKLDDGQLDLVVVEHRPMWQTLRHVPKLFSGRIAEVPDVMMVTATDIQLSWPAPVLYHVDGEPFTGGLSLAARAHSAALRVHVPLVRGASRSG